MKVAIVVQGRFHAFHLAKSLMRRGHSVQVLTNYPKWAARRFGLSESAVSSYWAHGVASRAVAKLSRVAALRNLAPPLLRQFGRWAAQELSKGDWDVIHPFSGAAEEILRDRRIRGTRWLMRGSAHIQVQDRLLAEEEERSGCHIERPDAWMIDRELREYELADRVVVLSSFAYQSFLGQGVPASKLLLLPLGVDTQAFRSSETALAERCERIRRREPLRVLFTGSLSYRKGAWDYEQITKILSSQSFRFRFVGDIPRETQQLAARLRQSVELVPRQPERDLPGFYSWADLFVFPTIEDGFAVVLSQAQANGLPILATANCSGPDVIRTGESGWVLPVRSPEAFIERLQWCDEHREDVASMVEYIHRHHRPRDWNEVAEDFELLYRETAACV